MDRPGSSAHVHPTKTAAVKAAHVLFLIVMLSSICGIYRSMIESMLRLGQPPANNLIEKLTARCDDSARLTSASPTRPAENARLHS